MRLVDTSAWIEILRDTPTGRALRPHEPPLDAWLVPTIVQLELVKWLTRELGQEPAERALALSNQAVVAPLTTAIAVSAAPAARTHKLSTADAIIYATAEAYGADVLTCDAHFDGLDRVIYMPKSR